MSAMGKHYCKRCGQELVDCTCAEGPDPIEPALGFVLRGALIPENHPVFIMQRKVYLDSVQVAAGTVAAATGTSTGGGR